MDFRGLNRFFWYHTVDLGDGIITPGVYDYRKELEHFHFPDVMSGMRVLDVGSATGFFAFEFEKRRGIRNQRGTGLKALRSCTTFSWTAHFASVTNAYTRRSSASTQPFMI